MPVELWDRASEVARRQGINRVEVALGLHYGVLKARVAAGRELASSAVARPARFVELSGAQVLAMHGDLCTPVFWRKKQEQLRSGLEDDVVPYLESRRFPHVHG